MSSFLALRGLLFAGEAFAASALVMALAWLAAKQETASKRHLTWLAAFGVLLALPIFAAMIPAPFALVLHAAPVPVMQTSDAVIAAAAPPAPAAFHVDAEWVAFAIVTVWMFGILVIAFRGVFAAIGLQRMRRESVGHVFRNLPAFARAYDLRISTAPDDCGPVTWGFMRPIILLPKSADFWPEERLNAVLQHEYAHIRRHDCLAQMVSLTICAFYWINPLVWIGASAMRREAEVAADDAVIVSGVKPSAYAAELLQLATEFRSRQPALANVPLFMAARAALEARVESVLAPTQQRSGVTSMDVLKIVCAGLLATSALVVARPSLAQDMPPPPPAPPAVAAPAIMPAAPAPVAQADLPVPPVPAAAPVPPAPGDAVMLLPPKGRHVRITDERRMVDGHEVRSVHMYVDGHETPVERAEIARAMAQASAAEAQMRAERPRMEEAMRDARPQIEKAIAEARAEMIKAHIDLKVQEKIDRALQRVVMRVDSRTGDVEDGKRGDIVIERTDQPDGDIVIERTEKSNGK